MPDYRDAAVTLWGDAGAYAHDAYARWRTLFPGLPNELPIVIGITAYGKCLGATRTSWEHGPRITIASRLFRRGRRHVEDTMLHEMGHAWLALTGQDADHDTEAWYAMVRRLSPAILGNKLDARRGAARRSVRVPNPAYQPGVDDRKTVVRKVSADQAVPHAVVASWPVRRPGYDYGDPMPCPLY